jgi:hypothetical protein
LPGAGLRTFPIRLGRGGFSALVPPPSDSGAPFPLTFYMRATFSRVEHLGETNYGERKI